MRSGEVSTKVMPKISKQNATGNLRNFATYTDLGLRFAVAAALGGAGGYWLDGKLGTSPVFLILGVMLGGVAGFVNLYRTTIRLTQEEKAQIKAKQQAGPPGRDH
ncbi:MAG: AtpZ/AtpI family protein [bacterium]